MIPTKKIKVYKIIVDPQSKELTLSNIDPVSNGAIEREWLFFQKNEDKNIQLAKDNLRYITTAPALVPDRLIFRTNQKTGEKYCVSIDRENIENALKSFQRNNNQHNIQLDHEGEPVSNIYLHEVWIVDDPQSDKSKVLGFTDIPSGTLMVSHDWSANKKAFNDYVVTGKLNGYSIQAYLQHELIKEIEIPVLDNDEAEEIQQKKQLQELEKVIYQLNEQLKKLNEK